MELKKSEEERPRGEIKRSIRTKKGEAAEKTATGKKGDKTGGGEKRAGEGGEKGGEVRKVRG